MKNLILGIDTSCDDTSFAILDKNSKKVLENVVSSQNNIHSQFGGIMPEMASRSHLENLTLVFSQVLSQAQISPEKIAAVAVTQTPGLIGCLLVGTSFAQGLALQLQIPLFAVNHLEAHLFSPFMGTEPMFPCLGLVVSGGHTAFYKMNSCNDIEVLGQTVDDAAGEAFDKCAKMMGLGYPGGAVVDKLAQTGDDKAFEFCVAKVKMGKQYLSFSGLKTALRDHVTKGGELDEKTKRNLCASLQKAIVDALCEKLEYFLSQQKFLVFALSGGVAMNSLLRRRLQEVCEKNHVKCFIAKPEFCTDNGAMVAHAALVKKPEDSLFSLSVQASRKIQARKLHETIRSQKT